MRKYVKNIIICLICFLAIVVLNFALPRLVPGDPVAYLTGMDEGGMSVAQYEYYRHALHLDENVFVQFGYYLKSLFDGTLGYSYKKDMTVASLIGARIGVTLQISLIAAVISSCVALFWGIAAGSKNGITDKISTPLNVFVNTLPAFLVGMILIVVCCFEMKIFPYSGLNSVGVEVGTAEYFFDRIYHLILPILVLVISLTPSRYLLIRNNVRSIMTEKYVLFAKQRGLSAECVKIRYILPNVIQPFLTSVGMTVGASIGGSAIIENLFSIGGMGTLLMDAVYSVDYPLMQGILFVTTSIALLMIIVTDVVCIVVDPKSKKRGAK